MGYGPQILVYSLRDVKERRRQKSRQAMQGANN